MVWKVELRIYVFMEKKNLIQPANIPPSMLWNALQNGCSDLNGNTTF